MHLPIIDMSPLYSEDRSDWKPVISQLDSACRKLGFFYITGHGIPQSQFELMELQAKRLFEQSIEEKQKISIEKSSNHRGWGKLNAEQLDPEGPTDCKETFDMALDLSPHHPQVAKCPQLYGPNQYPDIHGFAQVVNQHYALTLEVGKKLLQAMAIALNEKEDFFTQHFSTPISVLRFIHYPSQSPNTNGAGEHTDYGCITLLHQDKSGGLQVRNKGGEWIDAPPIENAYVVNIGDLMQRWTNGIYQSTPHRVTCPTSGKPRFSMPFFVEPDYDTPVSTLRSCMTETSLASYPDTTAGEWILSRFADTYSYRDEPIL